MYSTCFCWKFQGSHAFSKITFHTFSIPDVNFGKIQYLFKVWITNFEIHYFQYRMGTLKFVCGVMCNDLCSNGNMLEW